MISVYKIEEIKNKKIVYIGESKDLYKRWSWHTNKYGKFNKEEYKISIIKNFIDRKDARQFESQLKLKYGLELTEIERVKKRNCGKEKGSKIVSNKTYTCPKCGIISNGIGYFRWHGDKCKK
jgi:predicted GIY-YIG superfamily endonuclease